MASKLTYNNYSADVRTVDGKRCLRLQDLSHLSKVHFTSIYRVFRKNKFKLSQYICDTKKRGTYLTLEGCVAFLKCFKFPDDGLIWKIENTIAEYSIVQEKKDPAEQFVDNELFRLGTEAKIENLLKGCTETIGKCVDQSKELSFRDIIKQLLKEIIVEEFNKEENKQ